MSTAKPAREWGYIAWCTVVILFAAVFVAVAAYMSLHPDAGMPAGWQRMPGLPGYLGLTEPKGTLHQAPADTAPEGDNGTAITEVRLSDGTRCAVMDSPKGKALSCDWESSR